MCFLFLTVSIKIVKNKKDLKNVFMCKRVTENPLLIKKYSACITFFSKNSFFPKFSFIFTQSKPSLIQKTHENIDVYQPRT